MCSSESIQLMDLNWESSYEIRHILQTRKGVHGEQEA
jgi:hypothetical protein